MKSMIARHEGLWSLHAGVLLFGLTALFSKLIALDAIQITLLRSLFAVLALAIFIKLQRESLALKARRDYWMVVILGVVLGVHWVTYFHAMQVSTIAVGVISLYTFPVITVFLEPFFFNQRPHWQDVISAVVVFIGIYLLVPEFSLTNETFLGVLWGVFSALLFALRNIMQRKYFSGYPARHALYYQSWVVFLMLIPFAGAQVGNVAPLQWGQLLILGVFFTALPHTLFAHGLLHFSAKTASLIACMQVVYAAIFAALFLGEVPVATTVIGGLIVVSAALYETWITGRRTAS